ncbi:MAG: threonine/serine exporter family protein [Anaerolineaceae bacterium]|nr:threonine/serine exporter family protein [Anaerolineaceae bacterium]
MTILLAVLEDALWSGVAAVGFGVLFNVPRRALAYCALVGACGHAVRTLMMDQFGMGITTATLLGALIVGFMSKFIARKLKMPSMIFGITGAIPMVPGVFAYQTMIGLVDLIHQEPGQIQATLAEAAVNGVQTVALLGCLALGITAPTFLLEREHPVV